MTYPQPQRGFTIVETLVAITILMIAIAGPLSIASKGLTASLAARDQMIAAYLAQESMEIVKNVRDNNISLNSGPGPSWLPASILSCTSSNLCDIGIIDGTNALNISIKTGQSAPGVGQAAYALTLAADGYTHDTGGSSTLFSRHAYLTETGGSNPCQTSSLECTVNVIVSWREGTVPYDITLSSKLLNTER